MENKYKLTEDEVKNIKKDGYISRCRKYRYYISREWNKDLAKISFILLNPSETDLYEDNQTIRKVMGFAKGLGYGGIYLLNLYSYREANPKNLKTIIELKGEEYAIGKENFKVIKKLTNNSEYVIFGWGNNAKDFPMTYKIYDLVENEKIRALDITKQNQPKHPLYLRYNIVDNVKDLIKLIPNKK